MTQVAAIIGGGVIGGGWAARFLLNGWDVRVFDPDPEAERKIGEVLSNARRALPSLSDVPLPEEGVLSFHASISEAVAGAAWAQESGPERLDLKQRVYAELMQHVGPGAVIGSSDDIIITKQYPSAFFGTSLAATLQWLKIDTLLLTGVTTSGCVRATCIDAISHGFVTLVVEDAVGDRAEDPHRANLFDMSAKYADLISTNAAIDYLNSTTNSEQQ